MCIADSSRATSAIHTIFGIPPTHGSDRHWCLWSNAGIEERENLMATNLMTSTPDSYTLIFWGNAYDESATTIFATRLREAGLCVKIVGIGGMQARGQNGITLQADLCMSEINTLAQQTRCVVLPCNIQEYQQLENDPQLQTFYLNVVDSLNRSSNRMTLVVHHGLKSLQSMFQNSCQKVDVLIYPQEDALFAFTHTVAERLLGRFNRLGDYERSSRQKLFPGHLHGFVNP